VLKMGRATEGLQIRFLKADRPGFLVVQPFYVLEQMQSGHQTGRQTATTPPLMIIGPECIIGPALVDKSSQPYQFMLRINNRLQRGAEQIAIWAFGLLGTHHGLADRSHCRN